MSYLKRIKLSKRTTKQLHSRMCIHECLLNNFLDKDIQDFLRPLEIGQAFMFQSKFTLRDNFITPNGRLYNAISFLVLTLFVSILFVEIYTTYVTGLKIKYFVLSLSYVCTNIAILVSFFIANLMNSKNNVQLIINIQEAKRVLQLYNGNNFEIKDLTMGNRILFGVLIFVCIANQTFPIYFLFKLSINMRVTNMVGNLVQWYLGNTILYAVRMVKLIRSTLEIWFAAMKTCNVKCHDFNPSLHDRIQTNSAYQDLVQLKNAFSKLSTATIYCRRVFSVPVRNVWACR